MVCLCVDNVCLMSLCVLFVMYCVAWFVFVCAGACVCVSVVLCVCVRCVRQCKCVLLCFVCDVRCEMLRGVC